METETKTNAYIRLPLFASQVTGDPHGFDRNSEAGRYLTTALQIVRQKSEPGYGYVSTPSAEEVTELFQMFGIVRDDVLNFATCVGLVGYNKQQIIPMWKAALEAGSVLNVPLRELVKVDRCIPTYVDYDHVELGTIDIGKRNQCVFVVENSGVFSSILDQFEPDKVPPLICTHGQFKLATLLLLDKLTKNGVTIYYSGDFDPEGLQMAQRLLLRYPHQVQLWRYDEENYLSCQSGIELSVARLNKLASVHIVELQAVKDAVLDKGKSAYQEDLAPGLIDDIRRILSK